MKNILITGGAGFIGSNLSEYLLKKGFNVIVIDDLSTGKIKNISNNKIKFYKKDVLDINKINFKTNIDIVVHLAAKAEILISKDKEDIYAKSNLNALQSLLNFTSQNKIKKFIFASSASIYGDTMNKKINENFRSDPKHFYAYTKLIGEKMIINYSKMNKFDYTIFRFFNIYGKNSVAVVAKFIAQKLQNKRITIFGNGQQKRDFLHIDDLNYAIHQSIKIKKSNNQIYNLGSGKSESVINLKKIVSKKKDHIFLEKRNDDIEISIANNNKIKKHLNWSNKVSLKIGVADMLINDKKRLSKIKLPSIKSQQKLIKNFNKNN
jgi:UDP-glucose 4-epimerase